MADRLATNIPTLCHISLARLWRVFRPAGFIYESTPKIQFE